MPYLSRRSALGLAAAAAAAPFATALPAQAITPFRLRNGAWTLVSSARPDKTYWVSDDEEPDSRDDGKAGLAWGSQPPNVWRAFFGIPVSDLADSTIGDVSFSFLLTHTPTARELPLDLYAVEDVLPGEPLTWNTSGSSWLQYLGTTRLSAPAGRPDVEIQIRSAELTAMVQRAANLGSPWLSFGLRARNEADQYSWKRFDARGVFLEGYKE